LFVLLAAFRGCSGLIWSSKRKCDYGIDENSLCDDMTGDVTLATSNLHMKHGQWRGVVGRGDRPRDGLLV
jgi:hypothetical protein